MPSGWRAPLMGPGPLPPGPTAASGSARLGPRLLPLLAAPLSSHLGTEQMLTCYYVRGLPLTTV